MTRRRTKAPVEPHVRIQDKFYWVLSQLSSAEAKLYFALRLQAWRANGKRKNYISKSLRKIAKQIAMPWATAGRAMQGLEQKGFVSWRPAGIYLPELNLGAEPPLFSYDFDTAFDTKTLPRSKNESGPLWARGGPLWAKVAHYGPPTPNKHPNLHRVTATRNDHRDDLVMRDARPPRKGAPRSLPNLREGENDTLQRQAPPEIKARLEELQKKMGWTKTPARFGERSPEEQEQFEQRRRAELAQQRAELEEGETPNEGQHPDHDPGA